uniref:Uncharacterized protein MG147 n=1 Tax=Anthurium amnicola TaxID=1678845 RepID=A0A1D1YXX4_9ARAE
MLGGKLQRLRALHGSPAFRFSFFPNLRRKASNSWSAVQDTYLSTKQVFERHRVVFTVSTSVASLLTAWAGYSLRYHHQLKVEKRLNSIEQTMKMSSDVRHEEINKIVNSGSVSMAACLATACTTLVIGYGLGWRGGSWFAHRKFRRAQLKLKEQNKPGRWQLLKKSLSKPRILRTIREAGGSPCSEGTYYTQKSSPDGISSQRL